MSSDCYGYVNDTDGDGIPDETDLDDDNDGILDAREETCGPDVAGFDAYWNLENSTDDTSGNNHNLQNGNVIFSTDSRKGLRSASFDGSSQYLTYSDGTFLNQLITNFSYSFWVKPSSLSGTQTLLDEGGGTTGIGIRLNGNILENSVRQGGAGSQVSTSNFTFPNDGLWHHIGLTYANGSVVMYLDGEAGTTLNSGFGALAAHSSAQAFGRSDGDSFGAGTGNYFTGLMDEIVHYPIALSPSQMGDMYNGTCDTDNDGIINRLDTDSDADGCNDADEGYDNLNADTDNNGRYGSGAPTVDGSGKVVGASYPEPVDTDNDGIPNFLEAGGTPTITAQPQDQSVNPGDTANFSVSAAGGNLVYQWYVSTNGGSNYTVLSGETSSSIMINNVSGVEDGNLYRVTVKDVNNLCSNLTSVSAVLQISNMPPIVDAEGDQDYCPGLSVPIAESISITDPDDTVTTAVFIQISSGYINGEDLLTLTGTHPNIIATWNAMEGELSLTGPATYSEFEAAILAVEYTSSAGAPTGWRQFSITVGEANYLPATGHYYMYVDDLGITWTDANTAANASTYFGQQGYLATLTSQEEADFSGSQAAGTGWIGGSDAATEGVWKWVTGPEAGLNFWNGLAGGSSPNFAFWNTGEPNNSGDEDYAHITHPNINPNGSWNDLTNTGSASGDYQPQGYVVEYGGMPGDPALNISDVTSITMLSTAIIDSQPVDQTVCLGGDASFNVTATGANTYQWQLFDGSIWNDLTDSGIYTGTTSATVTVTGPSVAESGNRYRVVLSSDCSSVTSNTSVLTVTDVSVDAGSNQTICDGDPVTLTATPSNGTPGYAYLWNTGQTTANITFTPIGNPNADKSIDYTVTVTDTNGCQDTDTVRVTIESAPTATVNTDPASCGLDNGEITFNFPDHPNRSGIEFSLDNQTTYKSSLADNSGSVTYTGLPAGSYHLWVRWGNNECPVDLGNHTISDIPEVSIGTQPGDQMVFVNDDATFSVTANNADTYQWQVSTNGGISFTDIVDGTKYSGTQTATLTVNGVPQTNNGYLYRVQASNSTTSCIPLTSTEALLTVKVKTVITNRRITHRVETN